MYTAARLGFGNMVLMLPQRGKEVPPDKYAEVWQEVHGPGTRPPPPMLSGNYLHRRERRVCRGAGPQVPRQHDARGDPQLQPRQAGHSSPPIKGYEQLREHDHAARGDRALRRRSSAKGVVTGTPQMILERMWELKEIYEPQGFFPHVYFGGMPQDEALKNIAPVRRKGAARGQELGSGGLDRRPVPRGGGVGRTIPSLPSGGRNGIRVVQRKRLS